MRTRRCSAMTTTPKPSRRLRALRAQVPGDRPGRATTGRATPSCTTGRRTRSSTRCTSRASPRATRTSRRSSAAPTRAWRTTRRPAYLRDLGVTAVELLPVHEYVPEGFLTGRGLTNYWGYNTIGFFAPYQGYSAAVRAGSRGRARSPSSRTWSRRCTGRASRSYSTWSTTTPPRATRTARRSASAAWTTACTTGSCRTTRAGTTTPPAPGNSLNAGNPYTLRLIMDSLRYWLSEMHVDGFRFDLAATLGREADNRFDQLSAFFDLVAQDPVIGQAKLIAEPWDVGQADSYDLGPVPRAVAGVERQVPGLHARLLAQQGRRRRRVRHPVQRVVRPVRRGAPPPDRLGEPDHRARRLHAARPGLLRRQAQRGERRGQQGRHRRQPVMELRRRRPDR